MPCGSFSVDLEPFDGTKRVEAASNLQVRPLHAGQVMVSKRVRRTRVRVARSTRTRDEVVEQEAAVTRTESGDWRPPGRASSNIVN